MKTETPWKPPTDYDSPFKQKGQMFGENMILMFEKVCVCVCVKLRLFPNTLSIFHFYEKTGEEYQMGGSHTIFL